MAFQKVAPKYRNKLDPFINNFNLRNNKVRLRAQIIINMISYKQITKNYLRQM